MAKKPKRPGLVIKLKVGETVTIHGGPMTVTKDPGGALRFIGPRDVLVRHDRPIRRGATIEEKPPA